MDNIEMMGIRELTETELAMVGGGNKFWETLGNALVTAASAFGGFVGYMTCGGPCSAGGALGAGAAAQNLLNNPSSIPPTLAM